MSERLVHYEVLIRQGPKSDWALEAAMESRADAMAAAEQAVRDRHVCAAKVTKEICDASGVYQSFMIHLIGEDIAARPAGKADIDDDPPLCVSPSDLYNIHARHRIHRLLDNWLRTNRATAFELLHDFALAERLEAAHFDLTHAIQKIAIAEAQATGRTTHDVIRHYQRLIETTIRRLVADAKRGLFPNLTPETLDACLSTALAAHDPPYVLGGALARALSQDASWSAKLNHLLDLTEAIGDRAGRGLLFFVVEQPLSEILVSRIVLNELLGEAPDHGRSLTLMARVIAPEITETLLQAEPKLAASFPVLSPLAARLAAQLKEQGLASLRVALAHRLLAELQRGKPLHPGDPASEISTIRALARLLIMAPSIASPEQVQETFIDRSRRLLTPEFVKAFVDQHGQGAVGEVQALIRLAENVIGVANKRTAGEWLRTAVGGVRMERAMLQTEGHAAYKLAQLADLDRATRRIGLATEDEAAVRARLDHLADAVEIKFGFIQAVVRWAHPAVERLLVLTQLSNGDSAPCGRVAERARAAALTLLKDKAFKADLADKDADLQRANACARQLLAEPHP